jgi:hypothetical protein
MTIALIALNILLIAYIYLQSKEIKGLKNNIEISSTKGIIYKKIK